MNKELLISIKPEHLVNILNGNKILELRKSVPKDYKGWVNIYCTMGGKGLFKENKDTYFLFSNGKSTISLNGKVVARFWFDEYKQYDYVDVSVQSGYEDYDGNFVDTTNIQYGYYIHNSDLKSLCLTYEELENYGIDKNLYAWHIKQLEIFDEPKKLCEFYKANLYTPYEVIRAYEETTRDLISYRLQRPPESYQFVYVKELSY